jgi:dipeptidyl aminopeptidase/acylaminoacyl peptidase
VVINYRGSTGYGRKFEQVEDPALQAADIVAVERFLKTRWPTVTRRVLVASSSGSRVAARVLAMAPDEFQKVFLKIIEERSPVQ